MKALSDFSRVRMLKLLQTRELCACKVQRVLDLSQSTASKHLKMFEKTGLVKNERLGNWMLLSLTDGRQSE
jgi:DNA-binding transcriptional ArsR family regulator